RDAPAEELAVLADAAVPLLVIVDYAETRPEQITGLCRAAAGHAGSMPLRMLLLSRTAGDWWDSVRAGDPVTAELLDGTIVARLDAFEPEPEGQADAYRDAVHGFSAALPSVRGQYHHDWPTLAAHLTMPGAAERAAERLARNVSRWHSEVSALTLQMTALADLLDAADRTAHHLRLEAGEHGEAVEEIATPGPGRVEDRLLEHEKRYWRHSADRVGLSRTLSEHCLHDALTAAFLLGAADIDDADALLGRIPALSDQTRDRRDVVRRWIAELYPAAGIGAPWDTLQPDRLVERFVGSRLAADPGLTEHLVSGATPDQVDHLLTVYARAAHHPAADSRLGPNLTELCVRHPETLAVPAVRVATQVEVPGPLIAALRRLAADLNTPWELLVGLVNALPQASHNLTDAAAELTQRLSDAYRELAAGRPDAFLPDLAMSLNNLSNRLADLGRREEALAAITEATEALRELAAARPDAFLPDLATSLNNLSVMLADLGRREEALAAITEAAEAYRELAAKWPEVFEEDLRRSLGWLDRLKLGEPPGDEEAGHS
ncbi:MAG TPA: tetratricopeptide repeat protein, partial [Kineosporiaceae bacterium]